MWLAGRVTDGAGGSPGHFPFLLFTRGEPYYNGYKGIDALPIQMFTLDNTRDALSLLPWFGKGNVLAPFTIFCNV